MKQYFRNIYFNTKYIIESIQERDWSEFKHWFRHLYDEALFFPIRQIKYGIENLIDWFPIIWNDRNWDFLFIEMILRKKLHNTSNHIKKYNHHENWEKDVKSLNFCVKRLDEIIDNDYRFKLMDKHEDKWGKLETEHVVVSVDTNGKPLGHKIKFTRKNMNTDEEKEQERIDYRKVCDMIANREERCYKLLFDCMNQYIRSWWD